MIEVSRATPDDVERLLPLVAEYWRFEGMEHFDAERVRAPLHRLLASPALGAGWLATHDEAVVAYLLAVYVFSLEHLGLTAEIDEFCVLPGRRGDGIGARLLAAAEAEFQAAGCTNVSLQLARDNDAARAFYRRHGYAERAGFELLDKEITLES